MNTMTYDQFCLLLGDKDVQIYKLNTEVAELKQQLPALRHAETEADKSVPPAEKPA